MERAAAGRQGPAGGARWAPPLEPILLPGEAYSAATGSTGEDFGIGAQDAVPQPGWNDAMTTPRQKILWVDDEIEILRAHVRYLEGKGYRVTAVSNGRDALELIEREAFDVVLLDEMMPGMGGLEVLEAINARRPGLPVVMITKSEEENLMNAALGRRISDYLIKPVNPSQIFLACKKIFEARGLERGAMVRDYVARFGAAARAVTGDWDWTRWAEEAVHAAQWDLELDALEEADLRTAHASHLAELNRGFGRFVAAHYCDWIAGGAGRPLLSHEVVRQRLVPLIEAGGKAALIVIDCLRLDQWLLFETLLPPELSVAREAYCSILPTSTPYARNALFSGLLPRQIAETYPEYWVAAREDELGKNLFERQLLTRLLERQGLAAATVQYQKVVTHADADELRQQVGSFRDSDLVATVFTFVDTFTHGRSRDAILAEFAHDPGALRAHLRTWFERSILIDLIRALGRQGRTILITTDHGNLQVKRPATVGADRSVAGGPRFKVGRALTCDPEAALLARDPSAFGLLAGSPLETCLFAKEDFFLLYSHGRHEHARLLRDSFQHGGISLDEMVVPLATLTPAASV